MEILAVLLVIAVVVSMAVPVFRSVRYEIKNSQAKKAAKELAEAMRTYYQVSRGLGVKQTCFTPSSGGQSIVSATTCNSVAAEGIPYQKSNTSESDRAEVNQLFACGYAPYKDFLRIPYEFCTCNISSGGQSSKCQINETSTPYVVLRGASGAGDKYTKEDYYIYVDSAMQVRESAGY